MGPFGAQRIPYCPFLRTFHYAYDCISGLSCDETHPLAVLFKKGARVTINTDNLTVLDTSLEKEYELCLKMGLTVDDIIQMNNYAIEASFLSHEEKEALLQIHQI